MGNLKEGLDSQAVSDHREPQTCQMGVLRYVVGMSHRRAPQPPSELMLLLVPLLWGWGYPLIRGSLDAIGPLGFLFWRFLAALVPLGAMYGHRLGEAGPTTWRRGIVTGVSLFLAYAFLNWGLVFTTTAKAGFIIGLRVILVPIVGALLFRLRVAGPSWVAASVSMVGLVFIFFGDFSPPLRFNPGDGLMVASALFFALHILLVARYGRRETFAALLVLQVATVALLSGLGAALVERALLPDDPAVWRDAALAGVFATGLAFWLQNRFQPGATADRTGVIFSSEPMFAAAFGFLYLGETLQGWQWAGAGLIIAAMLLARFAGPVPRE